MRRHLLRFMPVFMLALLVQILAPVGACFARSIAISDPLAGAILCLGTAGDHATDSPQNHHMRDGACAVCAVAHAAAPPVPVAVFLPVIRQVYAVAWRAYVPDARVARLAAHAQARAPPVLS